MPDHPHDGAARVHHYRHPIALGSRDLDEILRTLARQMAAPVE